MIEARQLSKWYDGARALHDVSFAVPSGQVVGLLGMNGAGKSTLLRIFAGLLAPSRGQARVLGQPVTSTTRNTAAAIGFLPERPPLHSDMTVRAFLTHLAQLRGMSRHTADARVRTVVDETGLAHRADDVIGTLSLGYKKRVGIAQAIVHEPALVLLDEPISGLDPVQIAEMRALVRRLAGTRTVLLSSHILGEIEATSDWLLVLAAGQLTASDTLANLARAHAERLEVHVRGPRDALHTALNSAGVTTVTPTARAADADVHALHVQGAAPGALAAALVGAGLELLHLSRAGGLESLFMDLADQPAAHGGTGA